MKIRFIAPLIVSVFAMLFLLFIFLKPVDLPDAAMSAFGSETVRAQVQAIIEDGDIDLGGVIQRYQIVRVELLEGDYQGIAMEMDYGKRQVLSSLTTRLRNRFNISVAEIDEQDLWQKAILGIAYVANETGRVNQTLDQVLNLIRANPSLELLRSQIEVL